MNSLADYLAREKMCRRHAELDKNTASSWSKEAEIWAKLAVIEKRLLVLKGHKNGPERGAKLRNTARSSQIRHRI